MSQKIFLLIIILLLIFSCHNSSVESDKTPGIKISDSLVINLDQIIINKKAHWIDSIFTRLHKRGGFNGTVLYAEKGRMVYKKAFGMADYRDKDTLTTESMFQLASVSKMFTAMAIMILKEDGKLDFDADVRDYLPDFPYENISVRHLLTHRSGLPRYMSLAHEKWKNKTIPLTNDTMLALFVKYKPQPYFKTNTGFHYCNTNYMLLACIVENISGKTYDKFTEERIFKPLEMNHTKIYNMNDDSIVPAYIPVGVTGYRYRGWRIVRERNDYLNGIMGDKGVFSCVDDLYKFDQALYNQTLISDSTLREAFYPGSPKYWKRKDGYGFGWRIKTSEDSTVYHYGWWKGFRAFYIRDMKNEKTIIVLSNKDKGPGSRNLWKVLRDTNNTLGFTRKLPPENY